VVEVQRIPLHDDAHRLAERLADGSTPLDHALADGEDFELVLAVPPDEADRMLAEQPLGTPLTAIGHFVDRPGLWRVERGIAVPLPARGYEHHFT
jgi:thiamine-monophosphate kinase